MTLISSGTKLTLHYRYDIIILRSRMCGALPQFFPFRFFCWPLIESRGNIILHILSTFAKLRKRLFNSSRLSVRPSVRLSVCMQPLASHWTDFHEIWYLSIFRNSVGKIQVALRSGKRNGTARTDWTDPLTFVITCRWNLLKTRNVSNIILQKIRTQILCSTNVFFSEDRAV